MQGILCLSKIIHVVSVDFVTNTLLIIFPSVINIDFNYRDGLLMKQL